MKTEKRILVFQAFTMYLLTGALILVIGTNLDHYALQFQSSLEKVAIFASVFALGRVSTVYATGYLTEKLGVQRILLGGVLFILLFLIGISFSNLFLIGCVSCFMGGVGMGAQDACCPIILKDAFPSSYASAMSAGQAFFGAGSFFHPFITALALGHGKSYRIGNYTFLALGITMIALLPFTGKHLFIKKTKKVQGNRTRTTVKQFVLLLIINFTYCAGINIISMFTVTYGQFIGLAEEIAPLILSSYSAGKMLGCIIFVLILRRVAANKVLIGNLGISVAALCCVLLTKSPFFLAACFFLSGLVLGVLFSIILTFATNLFPSAPARATAMVAIVGGGADVVAPLMLSGIMQQFGKSYIIPYCIVMLSIALVFSLVFVRAKIQERN